VSLARIGRLLCDTKTPFDIVAASGRPEKDHEGHGGYRGDAEECPAEEKVRPMGDEKRERTDEAPK